MKKVGAKGLMKNTLFLYIRMFFVLIINLYISRLILKYLGVEDFGIYNVVGSVVIFFGFLRQALTNATYRYCAYEIGRENYERLWKVFSMAVNCHVLLAIILFLFLEVVGTWFINNHLIIAENRIVAANWVFQFSLLSFVLDIVRTPFNSSIIAHEKMNVYAIAGVMEVALKLLGVFLLPLLFEDELIGYGIIVFVASLIVFLFNYFYNNVFLKDTKYRRFWDCHILREFVSYSGWSMVVNGSEIGAQQCISVFFNWFIGVIGNAALAISNQVNAGLNMFVTNLCQAFNPQLIKAYAADDKAYFMRLLFSASKISYILLFIIASPIIINIDYCLKVWLGDYPPMASGLIQIMIISYAIDSMQIPLWHAVHATGNLRVHQIVVGSIKLVSIPIIYLTLKLGYGGNSALLVWTIATFSCAVFRTLYMHFLINMSIRLFFRKVIMKVVILTIVVLPLTYYISSFFPPGIIRLLSSFIITFLISTIIIITFVIDCEEKNILSNIPVIKRFLK